MIFQVGLVGWLGLVLYAVYADCDPLTAKTVRKQVGLEI